MAGQQQLNRSVEQKKSQRKRNQHKRVKRGRGANPPPTNFLANLYIFPFQLETGLFCFFGFNFGLWDPVFWKRLCRKVLISLLAAVSSLSSEKFEDNEDLAFLIRKKSHHRHRHRQQQQQQRQQQWWLKQLSFFSMRVLLMVFFFWFVDTIKKKTDCFDFVLLWADRHQSF